MYIYINVCICLFFGCLKDISPKSSSKCIDEISKGLLMSNSNSKIQKEDFKISTKTLIGKLWEMYDILKSK